MFCCICLAVMTLFDWCGVVLCCRKSWAQAFVVTTGSALLFYKDQKAAQPVSPQHHTNTQHSTHPEHNPTPNTTPNSPKTQPVNTTHRKRTCRATYTTTKSS